MQIDRWVLPPAAAAALFTMMAIAPPGGPVARGLRIEVAGAPSASPAHPLLVRLVMDDAGTARWRVPREATLRLWSHGAPGTAFAARAVPGAPYLFGQVFPAGEGPYPRRTCSVRSFPRARAPTSSR